MSADETRQSDAAGQGQPAGPCVMVIFGATGDLTKRKLMPAIYNLAESKLLARDFAVVGIAKDNLTTDSFRAQISEDMKTFATGQLDEAVRNWLVERVYYLSGDFKDAELYRHLGGLVRQVDEQHGTHGNYFYYLATAPIFFGEIIRQLGAAGLAHEEEGRWRRVVIEKPFGTDLETARALNAEIREVLTEDQVFRIDHYLGKETVQNILVFRFGNGIFEPIWNRRYIDHVQITAGETVGVE